MLLHTLDTHEGDKTAVLIHGLMGSSESWWRSVPLLVDRGYRVLSIDLPGHGLSPRDAECTVTTAAASVVETLHAVATSGPIHAIGHSFGATVLAAADLDADVTVYVDSPLHFTGGADRAELTARYEHDRRLREDADWLRSTRSYLSANDAEVEAKAAARFDPATGASVSSGDDVALTPREGQILVHAEPSNWVSEEDKLRLQRHGMIVRGIEHAAHTIWYSHFAEFTASVPEMFGQYP